MGHKGEKVAYPFCFVTRPRLQIEKVYHVDREDKQHGQGCQQQSCPMFVELKSKSGVGLAEVKCHDIEKIGVNEKHKAAVQVADRSNRVEAFVFTVLVIFVTVGKDDRRHCDLRRVVEGDAPGGDVQSAPNFHFVGLVVWLVDVEEFDGPLTLKLDQSGARMPLK